MIFTEQKKEDKFHYEVEDVFGKITIDSPEQLKEDSLDMIVVYVLRMNQKELSINDNSIKITYEPRKQWDDEDNCGKDPKTRFHIH